VLRFLHESVNRFNGLRGRRTLDADRRETVKTVPANERLHTGLKPGVNETKPKAHSWVPVWRQSAAGSPGPNPPSQLPLES